LLKVAVVLLFLRNVQAKNANKMIIQGTFNNWLEQIIEISHKYCTKIAIGNFIAKLDGAGF